MITETRALVAATLAEGLEWPVHPYKPDDIGEVPCVVVDRPSVAIDVQLGVSTVPVLVLGNRNNTQEDQAQLDAVTDRVVTILKGPDISVDRVEPITAQVAELLHPAYRVTCTVGLVEC
jgi:hypothetical protein